jgi:hypothetical protein
MMNHVFIDLETLGTVPGSAIISIGAVRFDEHGVKLGRTLSTASDAASKDRMINTFYREVNITSNGAVGLRIHEQTLAWWIDQPAPARRTLMNSLKGEAEVLAQVLGDFSAWLETGGGVDELWCFGASFDFPMLEVAYDRHGATVPWGYKKLRCARTLFALVPLVRVDGSGTAHNALDDATRDAQHTVKCLNWLRKAEVAVREADHQTFLREAGLTQRPDFDPLRDPYGNRTVVDTPQCVVSDPAGVVRFGDGVDGVEAGGVAPPIIVAESDGGDHD